MYDHVGDADLAQVRQVIYKRFGRGARQGRNREAFGLGPEIAVHHAGVGSCGQGAVRVRLIAAHVERKMEVHPRAGPEPGRVLVRPGSGDDWRKKLGRQDGALGGCKGDHSDAQRPCHGVGADARERIARKRNGRKLEEGKYPYGIAQALAPWRVKREKVMGQGRAGENYAAGTGPWARRDEQRGKRQGQKSPTPRAAPERSGQRGRQRHRGKAQRKPGHGRAKAGIREKAERVKQIQAAHRRFLASANLPFLGNGFTRWVDGQYALCRPELGLSNWQNGRILARSAVLTGDGVFTVKLRVCQQSPDVHR